MPRYHPKKIPLKDILSKAEMRARTYSRRCKRQKLQQEGGQGTSAQDADTPDTSSSDEEYIAPTTYFNFQHHQVCVCIFFSKFQKIVGKINGEIYFIFLIQSNLAVYDDYISVLYGSIISINSKIILI